MHQDKLRHTHCINLCVLSVHYLKDNAYQKSKICILEQLQTINVNLVFAIVSKKFVDIKKKM